jgi:hypothetical protein
MRSLCNGDCFKEQKIAREIDHGGKHASKEESCQEKETLSG